MVRVIKAKIIWKRSEGKAKTTSRKREVRFIEGSS